MSVNRYLIQKQCGSETDLRAYALITQARNEAVFIEQTILSVICQTALTLSNKYVHFRRKEQVRWLNENYKEALELEWNSSSCLN